MKAQTVHFKVTNREVVVQPPDMVIPSPSSFKQSYFNLLTESANPFHRRGTEISQGYDNFGYRKATIQPVIESITNTGEPTLKLSPSQKQLY